MRSKPSPDPAILDAWRERGADRVDPLAFHYMTALRRRAPDYDGEARRELDRKLADLIDAYARRLARSEPASAELERERGPLGALADELARRGDSRNGGAAEESAAQGAPLPELALLGDFRTLWANVRTDSQVRRSLEQSSSHAGPLNSSRLVHRSLSLMRELSPGYLQQFLAYADALSWLEQMNGSGVLAAQDPPPRESGKPRTRSKPRKRRE
ncbi:DUF2894 domain-containing protein [Lysobacter sp. Root983]|uniref:DUF2894 domain-containing protein n=1 Tax=Lysobacter sp. Root983 TaxID=1736613 RepID=UPI00070D8122|nr:DUF2894 domain-containing protein [Lysobacter sp. Root983]KRD77070.1 hypothetical protein ASE43_07810 [Lysobacter sp. Root983]